MIHGRFPFIVLFALSVVTTSTAHANETGWFVKPVFGVGILNTKSAQANEQSGLNGFLNFDATAGSVTGLGIGYQYTSNISFEVFWEHRTNDSETSQALAEEEFDGSISSNIAYLNAYYHFFALNDWHPYVGLGVGWVEDFEIEVTNNGFDQRFSTDGDISLQVMFGADYRLSENWHLNAEARYGRLGSLALTDEDDPSALLSDFDYTPISFSVGFTYSF